MWETLSFPEKKRVQSYTVIKAQSFAFEHSSDNGSKHRGQSVGIKRPLSLTMACVSVCMLMNSLSLCVRLYLVRWASFSPACSLYSTDRPSQRSWPFQTGHWHVVSLLHCEFTALHLLGVHRPTWTHTNRHKHTYTPTRICSQVHAWKHIHTFSHSNTLVIEYTRPAALATTLLPPLPPWELLMLS